MADKHDRYRTEFDALKRKLEEGGIPWWRPVVGRNVIRILPNWRNATDVFYKRVLVHWNVGPTGKKKVICRKMLGDKENCPVCDFVAELKASSNPDDIKYGEVMGQTERYALNILDGAHIEEGPKVFECGRGLFQNILWMFTEGDYGDLDDYKEGRYILIERTGTGMTDTKYTVMPSGKVQPLDPRTVAGKINDLDKVYAAATPDEIIAVLEGKEPTQAAAPSADEIAAAAIIEEDGEVAPVTPPPPTRQPVTRPASARVPTRPAPAPASTPEPEEAPPSPDEFEAAGETPATPETNRPSFSRSEKVDERLKKLRRPSQG